jgi:hypothetical protein
MRENIVKVIDLVPGKVAPLTTVDASVLTQEMFQRQFLNKHLPVLIKGAARHWRAMERWDEPGYLESRCADVEVKMARRFNAATAEHYILDKMKLRDCFAQLRASPDDTTYSIPATAVPEQWMQDLGDYSFLGTLDRMPRTYPRDRIFIYKNASTEWHYHPFDETITTQLGGSKRFSLFRLTADNWLPNSELIESSAHHRPDGAHAFPADRPLTKYEGVLEAGDSVYIPPFWWHGVDTADTRIGYTLAHCFRTPMSRLAAWEDPITQRVFRRIKAKNKLAVPVALGIIGYSTLRRMMSGEKW